MSAIPDLVRSAALAAPDRVAVEAEDGVWTWATLDAAVEGCARWLAGRPGPVCIAGPAGAGFMAWLFAAARVGAVALPLSADAPVRAAVLEAVGPHVLVHTEDLPALCAPTAERFWPLDEVRLQVATSGSTGAPRLVPITMNQLVFSAFGALLRLGHVPGERWLACLPLVHVGGLAILYRTVFAAGTVVIEPFEARRTAARLDSGRIHRVSLTPTMLADVLDARAEAPFPEALRTLLVGGAACPPALVARCAALGAPVALTWGLTEAASQVCTRWPGDLDPEVGVGPPLAFARVDAEADGTLVVRGPLVAQGLERTSDSGWVDARGRVHVRGRTDTVIVSGGAKIDGSAIEAALCAHPAVRAAVVVGVPDDRYGERPVALLVAAGTERPEAALRAWCQARVGRFAAPDGFLWCTELPRTGALGKVDRAAARRMLHEVAQGGTAWKWQPE